MKFLFEIRSLDKYDRVHFSSQLQNLSERALCVLYEKNKQIHHNACIARFINTMNKYSITDHRNVLRIRMKFVMQMSLTAVPNMCKSKFIGTEIISMKYLWL